MAPTVTKTSKKCKDGEILREPYITAKGTYVKPTCVKATSVSGVKAEDINAVKIAAMLRKQKIAEKVTASKSKVPTFGCPTGTIRRAAFLRNDGTAVPAACIKTRGADDKVGLTNPKTGERVYVVVNDDSLHKYGYNHVKDKTAPERHAVLDKVYVAMDKNWLSLFRTLNYLAVVNKNHKELHDIFTRDRNYVKKRYGPSTA
jgi:hypothetical protein